MIPALPYAAKFDIEVTSTAQLPLPVSVVQANWKPSAVFQMSAPAPASVYVPVVEL